MTRRNLSRRLERLEARTIIPLTKDQVLVIKFISPDRRVVGTLELNVSRNAAARKQEAPLKTVE
jgi:hypothetical protein